MSSVDQKKFADLTEVFNKEFQGGTSIFDNPSSILVNKEEIDSYNENNNKEEQTEKDYSDELTTQQLTEKSKQKDETELISVQRKLNVYIKAHNLQDKLVTSLTNEGLLVTFRDNILFTSGSAEISDKDKELVSEISNLLIINPSRHIIISGHTDNIPIKNAQYNSNWELSVSRAVNFMKVLLENDKLNPSNFSAKGYGEYNPIAKNTTEKGREKNRRVEILIQSGN